MVAPSLSNSSTLSVFPDPLASWSGVVPSLSWASTEAPLLMRSLHASSFPVSAALCNGDFLNNCVDFEREFLSCIFIFLSSQEHKLTSKSLTSTMLLSFFVSAFVLSMISSILSVCPSDAAFRIWWEGIEWFGWAFRERDGIFFLIFLPQQQTGVFFSSPYSLLNP